jgi:hypothetical protein
MNPTWKLDEKFGHVTAMRGNAVSALEKSRKRRGV